MSAPEIDEENSKNYILRMDLASDLSFPALERMCLRGQMHIIFIRLANDQSFYLPSKILYSAERKRFQREFQFRSDYSIAQSQLFQSTQIRTFYHVPLKSYSCYGGSK